jgi:uncharacterized protein YdhG (YjbR/CyaY superfamily)
MATPANVDDYIASFPPDVQAVLQAVRTTMHEAAPDAGERISYGIPTLTIDGSYLVYFAGWKRHISVYPIPAGDKALERDLAPYRAAKGTLRFPLGEPIPHPLIERVVKALLAGRAPGSRR